MSSAAEEETKSFLRTRQQCPRCSHYKLRQLIVIKPTTASPPSYIYDFCEWCYYKTKQIGLYKDGN